MGCPDGTARFFSLGSFAKLRGLSVAVAFPKEGKVSRDATDEDAPYGLSVTTPSPLEGAHRASRNDRAEGDFGFTVYSYEFCCCKTL